MRRQSCRQQFAVVAAEGQRSEASGGVYARKWSRHVPQAASNAKGVLAGARL